MLKYFNQVIINTIQGEVIDVILPFEEQKFCSNEDDLVDSITEIYRLKTAWYTVIGPLCLGMILAGGADENIKKIEGFAENLGIAFQIKDDILGIYADEDNIGKNVGADITEFKQILLYAYIRNQKEYFSNLLRYYGKENLTFYQTYFDAAVRCFHRQTRYQCSTDEKHILIQTLDDIGYKKLHG